MAIFKTQLESVDEHGGVLTVSVTLPDSLRNFNATAYWRKEGCLHSKTELVVNWPSLGSVSLSDANICAEVIKKACEQLNTLATTVKSAP